MFNIRDIVRNNNATFYDFNTRKRISQKPRAVAMFFVAGAAALLCPNVSDNLLSGFLAVQSILLGFTVNIMFYLLGNREKDAIEPQSIEARVRAKRLRDLYHELFYNVSYFNMVAIVSIIIATALLMPSPEVPNFMRGLPLVEKYVNWLASSKTPHFIEVVIRDISMLFFYGISFEVIFSISRVIGRTSFYFERKMLEVKAQNPD